MFVFVVVDVIVYDVVIVVDDEVVVDGCGVVVMYLVLFEPFCRLNVTCIAV